VNPFRSIIQLSVGDFLAKTLNFVAFVYLARVLGVASYGVLEFALSLMTYFLLVADGGLEIWATREAARGEDVRQLAARVVPLRFLMATASFVALLVLMYALPDYPALPTLLTLFGLTLFTQALSLKWVFMGQEKMGRVAGGLVIAQLVFAVALFALVRSHESVLLVPVVRLTGDVAMVLYFLRLFHVTHGGLRPAFRLQNLSKPLKPAMTIGASQGLSLINYNFDSVLLGFFLGSAAVGWYGAAYKPVTVILAMPLTYFVGLFPALSRTYQEDRDEFSDTVVRSFRLTSIFAVPLGIGGVFLAGPVIDLLFGAAYSNSVPAFQILSWSATLVILRGTYRQSLNAAGRSKLDLRCAGASAALNVVLNLLLIPRYGILGAAIATVAAEVLWLTLASHYFHRLVAPVRLLPFLWQPAVASLVMAACFLVTEPLFWGLQAVLAVSAYFGTLLLLGGTEVLSWAQGRRARFPVSSLGD
jgi:O-antigen/teichoic acid export membrane protein